jgi:hypothetical protein
VPYGAGGYAPVHELEPNRHLVAGEAFFGCLVRPAGHQVAAAASSKIALAEKIGAQSR